LVNYMNFSPRVITLLLFICVMKNQNLTCHVTTQRVSLVILTNYLVDLTIPLKSNLFNHTVEEVMFFMPSYLKNHLTRLFPSTQINILIELMGPIISVVKLTLPSIYWIIS
jgi:hypothetical protein